MKSILRRSALASIAAVAVGASASNPATGYLTIPQDQQETIREIYVNPNLFVDPAAPSTRAEGVDSVTVSINVTLGENDGTVKAMYLLPMNPQVLGQSISGKKDVYQFRVPKDKYEIWFWAERKNYDGKSMYYRGNIDVVSDTTLYVDNADCNIRTSYELTLPNGEPVQPDLYITTTKTIAEKGNVRNGANCLVAMRLLGRNVHFNHTVYNLTYQKSKADATAISYSWGDTKIFVNTKDIPMDFLVLYKMQGEDGVYTVRFDVNKSNFGDTLCNKVEDWMLTDLKYGDLECDSVPEKYNPDYYNSNGFTAWLNGAMVYSGTGWSGVLPTDSKTKYWLSGKPNTTTSGYDFAVHPGRVVSSIGTRPYGTTTLPLTIGKNGPEFAPFQTIFTGLTIWAYSDGTTAWINRSMNQRLNGDENTVWGSGFPFAGIYPKNTFKTAATPQFDMDVTGPNGDKRGSDLVVGNITTYRQNGNSWDSVWAGKFEKLSTMNTAVKNSITANGAGRFAIEFVDTAYTIKDIKNNPVRGKSTTRSEFSTDAVDFRPPTITMLNVRNADDVITTDIDRAKGGTVEVYAADLTGIIVNVYGYSRDNVKGVTIECAPNGSTDFVQLPVQENKDRFKDLYWGQNFSANLDGVSASSENGLYDIRVVAEDFAGNTYSVVASPAFKFIGSVGVENSTAAKPVIAVEAGAVKVYGMQNAAISVYDLQGRLVATGNGSVDASSLSGLYIVKAADAASTVTAKVVIR